MKKLIIALVLCAVILGCGTSNPIVGSGGSTSGGIIVSAYMRKDMLAGTNYAIASIYQNYNLLAVLGPVYGYTDTVLFRCNDKDSLVAIINFGNINHRITRHPKELGSWWVRP